MFAVGLFLDQSINVLSSSNSIDYSSLIKKSNQNYTQPEKIYTVNKPRLKTWTKKRDFRTEQTLKIFRFSVQVYGRLMHGEGIFRNNSILENGGNNRLRIFKKTQCLLRNSQTKITEFLENGWQFYWKRGGINKLRIFKKSLLPAEKFPDKITGFLENGWQLYWLSYLKFSKAPFRIWRISLMNILNNNSKDSHNFSINFLFYILVNLYLYSCTFKRIDLKRSDLIQFWRKILS